MLESLKKYLEELEEAELAKEIETLIDTASKEYPPYKLVYLPLSKDAMAESKEKKAIAPKLDYWRKVE